MIRLLVKLGKWLETRFPEKVVVTSQDYLNLRSQLNGFDKDIAAIQKDLDVLRTYTDMLREHSVHKGAVQDLIKVVNTLKDDYTSFKASMGFNSKSAVNNELQAMLNGDYLSPEEK